MAPPEAEVPAADLGEKIAAKAGAVLLCGGQGRRMGGIEKCLLPLLGKPLWVHAAERLRPQVSWIAVSANRESNRYAAAGLPVLPDRRSGTGPLAGVEAAWEALPPDLSLLLAAPGDSPFLPDDLVVRLFLRMNATGARGAFAHDGARGQFLCALFERRCAESLRDFLDRGERRAEEFLRSIGAAAVDFSDRPADFWNVNAPEDWERILQRAAAERKAR